MKSQEIHLKLVSMHVARGVAVGQIKIEIDVKQNRKTHIPAF